MSALSSPTHRREDVPPARRRGEDCLNCGYHHTIQANYCPQCGQRNTEQRVALGTLLHDFVQDYFTFDSKLFRSLGPLLFRPGGLTQAFMAGRRARYIPPIRLYVFISLVYFFILSLSFQSDEAGLGSGTIDVTRLEISDSLRRTMSAAEQRALTDSIFIQIEGEFFSVPVAFLTQQELTTQQVLDSLGWAPTWWNRLRVKQGQKIFRMARGEDITPFKRTMVSNFSVAMFGVMPALGGMLALLYYRRKRSAESRRYYVEYLVMAIHLQSFFFLLLILGTLCELLGWSDATKWLLLPVPIYIWLALRRAYGQTARKTTLKTVLFVGGTLIILGFFSVLTTLMSLFTF